MTTDIDIIKVGLIIGFCSMLGYCLDHTAAGATVGLGIVVLMMVLD